jgi:uncharacterized SAM-dependent methyltransferase
LERLWKEAPCLESDDFNRNFVCCDEVGDQLIFNAKAGGKDRFYRFLGNQLKPFMKIKCSHFLIKLKAVCDRGNHFGPIS